MSKVSLLTLKGFDWETGDPSTIENLIDRIREDDDFEQKCIDILSQHTEEPEPGWMIFWIILALGQAGSENAIDPLRQYLDHPSGYLIEEFALHALSHLEEPGARGVMEWFQDEEPSWPVRLRSYAVLESVAEHGDKTLREDTIEFLKGRMDKEPKVSEGENLTGEVLHILAALEADEFVLDRLENLPENADTRAIKDVITGKEDFSDMRMYNQSWREFADKKF